ncbi:MAG: class I SAM-dependent methyltransferase [candidate division Zixibacteria bacterium]|nr:class I SAM-dependent methyltransferase [candidate division Zixibacteria bacterium]
MVDRELIRYYRARAAEYEQIYYRDKPGRRAELEAEGKRLEQLVTERTVLDIPCGTGYWLQRMSRTADHVVGADIAMEMIEQARDKTVSGPVDFVLSDLYSPAFAADSFDVIALGFWFSHHPHQSYNRLFDMITYPLRSSGLVWMIDNNPPAERPVFQSAGQDKHSNHYVRRYLEDDTEFTILKNYFTRDQLEAVFSPRFRIERLTCGRNYWSVVLAPK